MYPHTVTYRDGWGGEFVTTVFTDSRKRPSKDTLLRLVQSKDRDAVEIV